MDVDIGQRTVRVAVAHVQHGRVTAKARTRNVLLDWIPGDRDSHRHAADGHRLPLGIGRGHHLALHGRWTSRRVPTGRIAIEQRLR